MTAAPPATKPNAVATRDEPQLTPFEVIERVITNGDLAKMTAQERVAFYWRTCESLGLNPLTRPFEFINLNGKLTMYARKDATDQLRKLNAVSVTGIRRETDAELGLVTVYATGVDGAGRTDEAEGVVSIKGLSGEALANALMKAATKAKRRLTLSLVGLGFLDESELETASVDVDPTTGEITERAKPKSLLEAVKAQQEAMAAAPADDVEGESREVESPTWLEGGAAAPIVPAEPASTAQELDFAGRIRNHAVEGEDADELATPDELLPLRGAFKDWDGKVVAAGIHGLFDDEEAPQDPSRLSKGQARAIAAAADSLGPEAFTAAWQALVAVAASA